MYNEIDKKSAYISQNPIRDASEMPKKIVTDKIDEEWDKNIQSMWWHHSNGPSFFIDKCKAEHIGVDLNMYHLRDKLLSFGGYETCLPTNDEDVDDILKRGQLWYGDRIHMMLGRPSQCHRNSAYCWYNNRDKTILCTGYALSQDGMWRCHSWLVELCEGGNKIIETTKERVAYFGFAMTEEEAEKFYFDNE